MFHLTLTRREIVSLITCGAGILIIIVSATITIADTNGQPSFAKAPVGATWFIIGILISLAGFLYFVWKTHSRLKQ